MNTRFFTAGQQEINYRQQGRAAALPVVAAFTVSEETVGGFELTHITIQAEEPAILLLCQEPGRPVIQFMLTGSMQVQQGFEKKMVFPENTVQLYHSFRLQGRIALKEGETFQSFQIAFPLAFAESLDLSEPLYRDFLYYVQNHLPFLLPKKKTVAPALYLLIAEILRCGFMGEKRNLYLQPKLATIVFLAIDALLTDKAAAQPILTFQQIQSLLAVKAELDADYSKFRTAHDLFKKLGPDIKEQRRGFKILFGMDIFSYLLHLRMEQAIRAVVSGQQPIDEIATAAGYSSIVNFITAFKTHFVITTPAALRRHYASS